MVVILSTAAELKSVVDLVVEPMAERGFSDHDIFAMRLALEEALVNSLRHGNRYDPDKKVQVRFDYDDDDMIVEVEDEGDGFDPNAVPDPTAAENLEKASGRGLLLMRHYTTWMGYNQRGNRVTLVKRKEHDGRSQQTARRRE